LSATETTPRRAARPVATPYSRNGNGRAPNSYPPRRLFREHIADYAIRDALLRHAEAFRGRLLDVGCGDRRYEPVFRQRVSSWTALDWPVSFDGRGGRPDIVADALRLPITDASFDTVLCTQVLEHVPEPQRLLAEAFRVLRPGGQLVLTAPQYNALHEEPRDFFRYTCYGLDHLAAGCGFTHRTLMPIGGFLSLFAFITTIHLAPLRLWPVRGLWHWLAWHGDRLAYRPKDCMGYLLVAERPADQGAITPL